ncbi:MAG TPA: class I SAM-dependent methyltransferase [Bryobacteraceae bacterium]
MAEQNVPPEMKQAMRAMWMAGDFGKIAEYSAHEGEEFVERLALRPGMNVLDVACGTGNLAVPAAARGAKVTGLDLAPNLLEQARKRATAAGLDIRFDEGDAEELPYADGSFDLVMSMYGAMFAPRPERVAAELARVTKPGGTIAMANWTPEGFVGKVFALGARHVPLPDGMVPPVLWGDEKTVRQRLAPHTSEIETTRRNIVLDYPFSPSEVVAFFREYFGPTKVAFARLDPGGQAAYAADLERAWSEHNQGEAGQTRLAAEYLEVIATRA